MDTNQSDCACGPDHFPTCVNYVRPRPTVAYLEYLADFGY